MLMGIPDRTYEIEGFKILVGIEAAERLDDACISMKFRISCEPRPGQRSGTWSNVILNNYFSDRFAFEKDLERAMRTAAEILLPPLKGESQSPQDFCAAAVRIARSKSFSKANRS